MINSSDILSQISDLHLKPWENSITKYLENSVIYSSDT